MKGWFWDLFETNPLEVEEHWYLLSYAYQWEGNNRVRVKALPDFRSKTKGRWDDKLLVKSLWELMNSAELIICHNGDNFDVKKANARFIYHGLVPPAPYKTVDTLKVARKAFKFDSNKLDFIGHYLGVGRKLPHTGKNLWFGCMRGDIKAWKTMRRYNAQDVHLLRAVYLKLRPYMSNHPDIREGTEGCPACRSYNVNRRGFHKTQTTIKRRMNCTDCGYWYLSKNQ